MGGLAEYAYCQAEALSKSGAEIIFVSTPDFLNGRPVAFAKREFIGGWIRLESSDWPKKLILLWNYSVCRLVLAWHVAKHRPDLVFLHNFVEYMAPLWIWPHLFLAKVFGNRYAANLHDPVRSYAVGPKWWHRWSVWLAYLPLEFVTIHEALADPSMVPKRIRTVFVPHGLYEISPGGFDPASIRAEWGVAPGQKVFLAFGFVRDAKNLDLSIRALAQAPKAFLVVAGSVVSPKDRQFSDYRALADELGVAGRCRFFEGFVDDAELGKYFAGADFVLLTYASSFHSQSGVLNLAARARKQVLASGSPSALVETVKKFDLGIVVAPDSLDAVVGGMKSLLIQESKPRWDEYEGFASWAVNAAEVLKAVGNSH